MERYDPLQTLDPSDWLALGESARIDLVVKYHRGGEVELPNETLHATIHVVVENQLALGVDPVPATIARLMRQGLDRHEAVHAVGAIFAEDIYDLSNAGERKWDHRRYRKRLDKLTAKRWRKGKW